MAIIILGLLFLCFVPMNIFLLLSLVMFLTLGGETYITLKRKILYFASTRASSNSSLNVAVYFWNNAESYQDRNSEVQERSESLTLELLFIYGQLVFCS